MCRQLTHPLVSPVLHGSLGGLCPLYIIAGDGEVLRDEIIYLAHRAADPASYPLRDELLARGQQNQVAERWTQGNPVHLQVFDGMCHVLTVFTFTAQVSFFRFCNARFQITDIIQAKLVYRQVAAFMRHLTTSISQDHSTFHQAFPSSVAPTFVGSTASLVRRNEGEEQGQEHTKQLSGSTVRNEEDEQLAGAKGVVGSEITESPRASRGLTLPQVDGPAPSKQNSTGSQLESDAPHHSISLLRSERVSIHGKIRPLEPEALRIPKDGIGVVKAAPVKRWLTGQDAWDAKYKRTAKVVEKERAGWEKKALEVMKRAGLSEDEVKAVWKQKTQGARGKGGEPSPEDTALDQVKSLQTDETDSAREERMRTGRRWGPLDLAGEIPPPSAIAGRLDTPDAVDLLKASLGRIPRKDERTKVKQTVDRMLHSGTEPVGPRRHGAAEQQVPANPMHGVRMWGGIMG